MPGLWSLTSEIDPLIASLFTKAQAGSVSLAGLDPQLGGATAVAAYVTVIALMAAQAIGRASTLRTHHARWVAVGACFFMLSDALIAVNKFLAPVPLASLWVLVTYYAAQMLMLHFARPQTSPTTT